MNTNKIKAYAPRARRDFIAAVTRRAAKFGLTAKSTSIVREEGQLVFIEGQPYPKSVGAQRHKLAARIKQHGFAPTLEAAAYTWFNQALPDKEAQCSFPSVCIGVHPWTIRTVSLRTEHGSLI